jgi:hypothetical protein
MNKLQKTVIKSTVKVILETLAFSFRNTKFNGFGYKLNSFLAQSAIKRSDIKAVKTLDELGESWQKSFPSKKEHPLIGKDEMTIYGEIHTNCPLRGTGDTTACYKMMSYDREILSKAGGQLIVLQSQAEKGNEFCKVAMRFKNQSINDLTQAHEKT